MSKRSSELAVALASPQVRVREQVPLAPRTHVRIGGPAELLAEPLTVAAVAGVIRACRELDAPLHVLGGGSNLLVDDTGVPGVVLCLERLQSVVRDGERLCVEAGVDLRALLRASRSVGLAGLETLCGIPAAVGGAVAMNAGTRYGETFDHLVSVLVVDRDGELRELGGTDLQPAYRTGNLGESVCLQATFALERDDPRAIRSRFEKLLKRRSETQPVTKPSAGCVFRNPPGESAGALIEGAGCKLLSRGGLMVSPRHANFFINTGGGAAADFRALMAEVQARVIDASGVRLEPEVVCWPHPGC